VTSFRLAVARYGLAVVSFVLSGCGAADVAERTTWDICYLQGSRVGYARTTIRQTTESGRQVLHIDQLNHLAVQRGNDRAEQEIRCTSVETPDGQLIRFECEMQMGTSPIRTVGRVSGNRLDLETTTAGKTLSTSIPWSAEYGGPFATEQTLLRKPMQPNERRTFKSLAIGFNQVADMEMAAKNYEPTHLPGGDYDLLRIDTVTRFSDGQKIEAIVWTDRGGDTVKTRSEAMKIETYRATEAEALAKSEAPGIDLLGSTIVKLEQPIPKAHRSKQVRYRVHLDGGDPLGVFVTGPTQKEDPLDIHRAEVTVFAIRPGEPGGNPRTPADLPTDADRRPGPMIQSDDPAVVAEAKQGAGDETDPWRVALALEQYVHRAIAKKDYSQTFATAAEVAKSHEGDCTEHAVFLAALARARGIPARVAVGLVYMESVQAFGYHMWTELWIDGRWIPVDGTLALGGIGAAHLKIAQTSLDGSGAFSAFLPVAQVVGRLRVEAIDAE